MASGLYEWEEEMKNLKTILAVVLVLLSVVLVIQNAEVVTLRFLVWELAVSRIVLIPSLVLVGFLLGYVIGTAGKRR